jgi:hypothetical protein
VVAVVGGCIGKTVVGEAPITLAVPDVSLVVEGLAEGG